MPGWGATVEEHLFSENLAPRPVLVYRQMWGNQGYTPQKDHVLLLHFSSAAFDFYTWVPGSLKNLFKCFYHHLTLFQKLIMFKSIIPCQYEKESVNKQ